MKNSRKKYFQKFSKKLTILSQTSKMEPFAELVKAECRYLFSQKAPS